MKAVLLAGGLGTRLSEETSIRPKPMVEIGGLPILWHIMKLYSHYGFRNFIVCLGYKGEMIREYFFQYQLNKGDVDTLRPGLNPPVRRSSQRLLERRQRLTHLGAVGTDSLITRRRQGHDGIHG